MAILPASFRLLVLPTLKPGKRQLVFILSFIVLLGLSVFFLFGTAKKEGPPGVAAQVAKERISLGAVDQFAGDCRVSQKEAVGYLVDDKVLSLWASDQKVVITPEDQKIEEVRVGGLEPENIACVSLIARVNLLRNKLSPYSSDFKEGKFIIVNFGRYKPGSLLSITNDEGERQRLYQEEKNYADKLIKEIYKDLKSGNLTFDEAIAKVEKDPRVGAESPYGTSLQSGPFSAQAYVNKIDLLSSDIVRKNVDLLSPGQFSEPFIQSLPILRGPDAGKMVDERWIIAQVDKVEKGLGGDSRDLLRKVREKYQAEIYL